MLLDLVTVAVLAFFLTRIVGALRHITTPAARRHWLEIVGGLRPRHFVAVPVVLAAVITAAVLLVHVPGLDFGWWTAIGGAGNPVTGSTTRTAGTPLEWLVPLVFLTLLVPVLPLFAEREEQIFRAGAERDSLPRRAWRCVTFGLVHAIVGVPIGVALALSIGGAYFMWWYLRAYRQEEARWDTGGEPARAVLTRAATTAVARRHGVMESTRAHLAYNLTLVAVVVGGIVLWLAGG